MLEDVDAASDIVQRRTPPPLCPLPPTATASAAADASNHSPSDTAAPDASAGDQGVTVCPATPPQGSPAAPSSNPSSSTLGPAPSSFAAATAERQLSAGPSAVEMQLLMTQLQLSQMNQLATAAGGNQAAHAGEQEFEVVESGTACGPSVPWSGAKSKTGWYKVRALQTACVRHVNAARCELNTASCLAY